LFWFACSQSIDPGEEKEEKEKEEKDKDQIEEKTKD
jgi:hypothetical protein